MNLLFENPVGLWALLGIPALIAIHTLQARARHTRASTLFLLEHLAPESRSGWHWERLRSSLPLWLQFLAVLALTWVLAAPRWVREESSQQVVVVLDASLSMSAFLEATRAGLPPRLRKLEALAAETEWTLVESNMRAPTLYRGRDLGALLRALEGWAPTLGGHDFTPALQFATSLVRGNGVVVFVTDHAEPLPGGPAMLSFAKPQENTGFVGSSIEEKDGTLTWRALVRNHGVAARSLEWHVKIGDGETVPNKLTLAAGETQIIGGVFPSNAPRLSVQLQRDAFPVDDVLPLVRPRPKPLRVALTVDGPEREIATRLLRGISAVQTVNTPAKADLLFARLPQDDTPATRSCPAIFFPAMGTPGEKLQGWVVAEKHNLVADTAWQSLVCAETGGIKPQTGDHSLVWRGGAPLIFLRQDRALPAAPSLVFNFHIPGTNAARIPAFVVLLRRYIEKVREDLPMPQALNATTHQAIPLACDPAQGSLSLRIDGEVVQPLSPAQTAVFRAPARPCFFQITQGSPENILLEAGVQFSDLREAALKDCGLADTLVLHEKTLMRTNSLPDPLRRLWLTLLLALPLAAWIASQRSV
ncbi:MAG: BatA and WFA domain-containing protein [Puniceicoccales bacterium]|jgi:hypothetical protein|nr:BatA and WFA domain-containing protein [Puniceicoccales bacterium]